jgi:hypothetical protein
MSPLGYEHIVGFEHMSNMRSRSKAKNIFENKLYQDLSEYIGNQSYRSHLIEKPYLLIQSLPLSETIHLDP